MPSASIFELLTQPGAEGLARLVQGVSFVGVPFFGTVSALVALLEGTFFKSVIPKEVVRTWPAIHQMLPGWSVTRGNPNRPELLLDATWMNAGLLPAPGAPVDLSRYIDRGMLERARALHRAIRTGHFEPLRKLDCVRIIQDNNPRTSFRLPHFPSTEEVISVDGDTLVPDQFTRDRRPSWVQDEATIRRIPAADHSRLRGDPNVFGLCLRCAPLRSP